MTWTTPVALLSNVMTLTRAFAPGFCAGFAVMLSREFAERGAPGGLLAPAGVRA